MKKLLFVFVSIVSFIFTSCQTESADSSKTIIIDNFPDNVSEIQILTGGDILNFTSGGINKTINDFSNNITINVSYEIPANSKKYAFYGNLTSDENPFKVFVNNQEMKNLRDLYKTASDEHLETNLYDYYMTTFSTTGIGDSMVLTFENTPRLIAYDEIRIADGTIYSYFDVSGLADHVRSELKEELSGSTYVFLKPVIEGKLFYVNRFSQNINLRLWPETGYALDNEPVLADGIKLSDSDLNDLCFTYTFTAPMTSGQVIKISGCRAHLIDDSDFEGREFTSISIAPGEYGAPNIHEVVVSFNNNKSAIIIVDGKFIDNCYWYMESDDSCLIQYPVLENDWRSTSIYKISDGKYEFPFYYSKRGSIYSYTVILEKNI